MIDPRISLATQTADLAKSFSNSVLDLQNLELLKQRQAQTKLEQATLDDRIALAQAQSKAGIAQANQIADPTSQVAKQQEQLFHAVGQFAVNAQNHLNNPDFIRQNAVKTAEFIQQNGGDPTPFLMLANMPDDELAKTIQEDATDYTMLAGKGGKSVSELERERALAALEADPEMKTLKAQEAAIFLGIKPKAGTITKEERIAEDVRLTESVAESQKTIEQAKQSGKSEITRKDKAVEKAVAVAKEIYDKINPAEQTISLYDEALSELENGANTGTVYAMMPSFRSASKRLDNVIKRAGLNVIGNTTFGALSEKELDFALSSALPNTLEPEDLKKWIKAKKLAQQKVVAKLKEQAQFLGSGKHTLADYLELSKADEIISNQQQSEQKQNIIKFDANGNIIQ
jgi:hypothetical protein